MNKLFLLIALFLFNLTACTSLMPPASSPNSIQTTQNWILNGKIGIKTPDKTESAFVYWQQQGNIYHIRLFGPLGMGAIELTGSPVQVMLKDNQGKIYQAHSAEMLLQQNLGLQIPVDNLIYWVRALPAPHWPSEKSENAHQQLTFLKQQGWEIEYLDYDHNQPKLIQFTRTDINLRLLIQKWQFF